MKLFFFYHDYLQRGLDKGFEVEYSGNEECLNCLGIKGDCSIEYTDRFASLHTCCFS